MRPYGDARTLERRRLKAVNLLSKGLGPGEIAKQLGVDRRSVHRWLAAYRDHGMDGLARERDEVAIRGWVRDQWPRVKKHLETESHSCLSR